MDQLHRVLALLADGQFHSGEEIGASLGISRSAVWKIVQRIEVLGIELQAISGRGYRLPDGLELLQQDVIRAYLSEQALAKLNQLIILNTVSSTNDYLANHEQVCSGMVCLAEQQTAGKGRRGRSWVSPFGVNIYLSLCWRFPEGFASLTGLSLVAGIAVAKALQAYGLHDLALKWPNDVLYLRRKLAGILVEITGDLYGPWSVVIGVGINIKMPREAEKAIDQPWTDIQMITGQPAARNQLVGLVLDQLLLLLPIFQQRGFVAFHQEWQDWDALQGHKIVLQTLVGNIRGIAKGVDQEGRLLIERGSTVDTFHSGEVSVRWSG